jgi:hypothetical protein
LENALSAPAKDCLAVVMKSSITVIIMFYFLVKRPCAKRNISEYQERPTTREPDRSYYPSRLLLRSR